MPYNTAHPDYTKALERYKLIRAIISNDAQCYIRRPDVQDELRNERYREDAILTNFTALTCEAFVGLVFSKKLTLSLPPELSYLMDDTTGSGINIWQFAQSSVSELLQVGRNGLLVDYDNDAQKAFIKPYRAEAIINWKTGSVNGYVQPWLIVLEEQIIVDDEDIFSQDTALQYRVLILEDGVYKQYVYNSNGDEISGYIPLDYNGRSFDYIPFVFIGSVNNDADVDKEPLYDMAVLNLGHYRNSADYEESIWINGQPYLVINVGEANAEEFAAANPNGVQYGSRKGLVLASGGSANLLQANPNQLVAQAMNEKLIQASKTGARLIEESGGRETAEAARIRYASQHSVLYTLTSNASWGIEDAIKIVARYMGVNEDIVKFKLNDQFYDESADGNVMNSYTAWFDRGIISADDMREYGKKVGLLNSENTDDVISTELRELPQLNPEDENE